MPTFAYRAADRRGQTIDGVMDADGLKAAGSMIGSAGVIVFDDTVSIPEALMVVARFYAHESCGQCTPCRVGTAKALALMTAPQWDGPLLTELYGAMMDASICGLGQAAPNPVLTVLKYFPQEGGQKGGTK